MQASARETKEVASAPTGGTDHLVCHKEKVTGTRIPQTVCRYQSQIKQDRKDAKRYLDDNRQMNARGSSVRSGTIKH